MGGEPRSSLEQLKTKLTKQFAGQVVLTYKGRDAIELALIAHGLTQINDVILTQAFSCYAIEEAIRRAGATAGYVDVGTNQLNLTVQFLEKARRQYKQAGQNPRAVIIQHSLGHPAEVTKIAAWCKKHQLVLIEDLAQSYGAAAGRPLGSWADTIILSFGRDKVVDAISGGAVIFHSNKPQLPPLADPRKTMLLKDLAYPFWTWKIRATYSFGLGKIVHKVLTLLKLMTNPTHSPTQQATALPASLAKLALLQLRNLDQVREHRQQIAALYLKSLANTPLRLLTQPADLDQASLLRFAATTDQPLALLNFLKHHQVHLTDRWYRLPVDCGKLNCPTTYQSGSCPNAEQLASTIINLPTHQKITPKDAEKIINLIKKYFANTKK
jgi:dTDP-4-amino-4,6-dideoxygalactose transaminase